MNRTQQGRVGELALALYAMVTSDGGLELFTPVSDEDHVDVTIGRRGALPAIAIQVKTAPKPDPEGAVDGNATYPEGHVREHPAFLYAVLLMSSIEIDTAWIVPSPDFNRLAYHLREHGQEVLEFRARADRADKWSRFQVPPLQLGPYLLSIIDSLEEAIPAEFMADAKGLVLGGRAR